PAAFRLVSALCRTMALRLVVTTGDLSGLGGPVEWAMLGALARWPAPVVFAPGNHDSELTQRRMRRLGAEVLSAPGLGTVGAGPGGRGRSRSAGARPAGDLAGGDRRAPVQRRRGRRPSGEGRRAGTGGGKGGAVDMGVERGDRGGDPLRGGRRDLGGGLAAQPEPQ